LETSAYHPLDPVPYCRVYTVKWKGVIYYDRQRIEVFSAGCPLCKEAIEMVRRNTCPSCEVSVLDMNDPAVSKRARELGIRTVPAVMIDGRLADCCKGTGPDEATLKSLGPGRAL